MAVFARIKAFLALPLAFFMLVTGLSFTPKAKQEKLEAALGEALEGDFVPVLRFAVATDVHINANDPTTADRLKLMFETAYRYADNHPAYNSLDAVVFTGDNCDSGSEAEYAIFRGVTDACLREGTEMIAVMGNHEFGGTGREGYEALMGAPLERHVVVKGFHFIGMSPKPSDTWHTPSQLAWMARELKKAADDAPDKPIFTMQHGHIWNTVYVSRSWYTQMSLPLHLIYSMYPQVVNFSGHSHGPVNNPISIWQNSYTQVGCGTLNYFEMERDIGDETVPAGARNAAQYLIVEVDADNRVLFRPFNILTDEFMKTPASTDAPDRELRWLIEDPTDTGSFAYTSARKKTDDAPFFEEGDAVTAESVEADRVTLTFPQAEANVCVYGYRITLRDENDAMKKIEKEIYSEYYFEPMPETLSCTVEGLTPGASYVASVTPLNVWLEKGAPIECAFTTPAG